MKLLFKTCCLVLVIFGLFSCSTGPSAVYHSYIHVADTWLRNDTFSLQVHVPDSLQYYQPFILVRKLNRYPYQNLAIRVEHDLKDTASFHIDTLYCNLSDKEEKIWNISEWGGLRQIKLPFGDSVLPSARTFNFKINHLMDTDSLAGINDLGILLVR